MAIEDFIRIRDIRLPNAIKAIELLGNLGAKSYAAQTADKRAVVDALYDAVDAVADRYGLPPSEAVEQDRVKAEGVPLNPAEGELVGDAKGEASWALEMIMRGDVADGVIMLKRALSR